MSRQRKMGSPSKEFSSDLLPKISSEMIGICAICNGRQFELFAQGYDYELRTCRNLWNFRQCKECGHVQLDPRPAIYTLPTIYPPHYYSYTIKDQVSPIALKGKELLDRRKLSSITEFLCSPPQSFIDVGCGDGRYLQFFEKIYHIPRAQLFGLELDSAVVENLSQQGYRVYCERVESCSSVPESCVDLATMFHVIEHVADPLLVIMKVSSWLAPGGVLAIETPNRNSIDAKMFRNTYWGGYHIPRHWHLFNEDTLTALLQKAGMEILAVKYQTGHSFWMYSFHHFLQYKLGMPVLARLFNPLKGLPMLIVFTTFDKIRAFLGFKTSSILIIARRK